MCRRSSRSPPASAHALSTRKHTKTPGDPRPGHPRPEHPRPEDPRPEDPRPLGEVGVREARGQEAGVREARGQEAGVREAGGQEAGLREARGQVKRAARGRIWLPLSHTIGVRANSQLRIQKCAETWKKLKYLQR